MKLLPRSCTSGRLAALMLGIFLLTISSLQAQDLPITGKVTASGGMPLIGVNVLIEGTSRGAATDVNGNFKLNAPAGATLKFTFVGYLPKEIKISNSTPLNVTMEEDVQKLNDVVVVGYGTQKKA